MTGPEKDGERPPKVSIDDEGSGRYIVSLPPEYEGDVHLYCTGGIVHKFKAEEFGRPTPGSGRAVVELIETSRRRRGT